MSNLVSEDLFEKLRGRFSNLTLGREDGVETLRPQEATFFEFDYKHKGKELGSVVISLVDEGALKIYFSTHMLDEVEQNARKDWYTFLKDMSRFASRNMLNYEAKNITKERLDKKDYLFLTSRNKSEEELAMESKLYGSKQKSYQNLNGAKIIVQHTNTVDEEKMGSRGRNIKAIYIENSQGERFRFENNYLPGARAMAMHISNGGWPNDDHGKHIGEIMKEMTDLKHFVRAVKRDDYIAEAAQEIIETASNRYHGLKNTLQGISRQRGYTNYLENFVPTITEVDENDVNEIKQQLTREVFDDRLNDSLVAVGRAMKLNEKKKGMFHDYDTWLRSAKSAGAEVEGDIKSSKAIRHRKEIGHWAQDPEDLEGTRVASGIEKPGYGEIGLDIEDRGDTPEREFKLPQSLELTPGDDTTTGMEYTDKSALLTAILLDIADRARDDEVSIFAGNIADKISSVGVPFGQEKDDPEFVSNTKKAIALANMYVKQMKNESVGEGAGVDAYTDATTGNTDDSEKDMFDHYETQLNQIAEGTWAIPIDLDAVNELQKLVSQHFPVGDNAENATSALYDIIGDDNLFDALGNASDNEGSDADARPVIKEWIDKFLLDESKLLEIDPEVLDALKNLDYGEGNNVMDVDVPETENIEQDEGWNIEVGAKVKRGKYYGKVIGKEKVMGEPGVEIKWDDGSKGRFPLSSLASASMDRKADYSISEEVVDEEVVDEEVVTGFIGLPVQEDDELDHVKHLAGLGAGTRSNHGIYEGEEGYQITPRSLVAREMRKLQDIQNK